MIDGSLLFPWVTSLESGHNFMLAGTGLDDEIDFKKQMTTGFVGDDLFIESRRESYNIHTTFEITHFCMGK